MFAKKEFVDFDSFKDISDDSKLEENLKMLGATGVEDLLQDKVKESIQSFRDANIKVWMLTGDKGETAKNVGQSCGIIDLEK